MSLEKAYEMMHSGDLYLPMEKELFEHQINRLDMLYEFNITRPTELEKRSEMLKKMFGFDKGGKLGSLESAFGGAAIMNMINQLGGKSSKSSSSSSKGASNKEANSKVRMANDNTSDYYNALKQTNVSDRKIGGTSSSKKKPKETPSKKFISLPAYTHGKRTMRRIVLFP